MTMKSNRHLLIVTIYLTLIVCLVIGAPSASKGDKTVPSHLNKSNLFYRGIYKTTIQALGQDYAKGKSPIGHTKDAGDFAPEGMGAFYVFDNEQEAQDWGRCHTEGTAIKTYVVVTYQYTPKAGLKTKSFTSADNNWLSFVESNYASTTKTSPYDIVEGPISAPFRDSNGKKIKVAYTKNGKLVWQGAFITPAALKTLVVADIKQYSVASKKGSSSCIIQ
ncbi:unnamed protein product [Adineta ricciae]|uniref:Uncharacterized protein n=1 Tax=Adineta ricciae TaxID=249248 RepID=A0A814JQL9_ADIRI|nr:unnamed protein product [Adineta ricciae]CAF1375067.1 unnamed protein product [Adineta ricciae]